MIILIALGILFVVGWVLVHYTNVLGLAICVLTGIFLCIALVFFPLMYLSYKSDVAEFNSTIEALKSARKLGNVLENAALQKTIIECNQWLASTKYLKKSIFGLWIPSEVLNLKPIE